MKNLKKNSIVLIFITLLVLFFVLKDDFSSVMELLAGANIIWLLIAVIAEFSFIFFEALAFNQIILSYNEDYSLVKSFKLLVITKFFNGITPFASGGQPMQIYLMKKDGIRMAKSTNIIMQNFIIYQLALVTMGIFAITFNRIFDMFPSVELLRNLVGIGFLVNTLVTVMLFVISFSDKFNKFIVDKVIRILSKTKIVKDKESYKTKWMERCDEFHQGAEFIKAHKFLCFKCYIYNLIALASSYIIPLFVCISLSGKVDMNILETLVASSYVLIMGAFVPIPGGSGGIEFGFIQFFGNFIKGGLLSATLLLWRFITYYVPMVIGAILFNLRKEESK